MKSWPAYLLIFFFLYPVSASAAAIDLTNHYAWNDNGGWVNWNPDNGNVSVTDTAVTGYIWSADFGWINLSPTNGGVTNNGQGVLAGYAWGEDTGWINFAGVTIDANGVFHGQTVAQSVFGTMTFDCTNCLVETAWRPSTSSTPGTPGTQTGGNGPIWSSGPLAPGYEVPRPATPTNTSSSARGSNVPVIPASLSPKTRPPSIEPTTRPPSFGVQAAPLATGISLAVSTGQSVTASNPISLAVNVASAKQRTQPTSLTYQLYADAGSVSYSSTNTLKPSDPSQFTEIIPTDGLTPGDYVVAVTAQYGSGMPTTQTLHVTIIAPSPAAANPFAVATSSPQAPQQCTSWFGVCLWQSITAFFLRLFAH
jgi:hypothetical protein